MMTTMRRTRTTNLASAEEADKAEETGGVGREQAAWPAGGSDVLLGEASLFQFLCLSQWNHSKSLHLFRNRCSTADVRQSPVMLSEVEMAENARSQGRTRSRMNRIARPTANDFSYTNTTRRNAVRHMTRHDTTRYGSVHSLSRPWCPGVGIVGRA